MYAAVCNCLRASGIPFRRCHEEQPGIDGAPAGADPGRRHDADEACQGCQLSATFVNWLLMFAIVGNLHCLQVLQELQATGVAAEFAFVDRSQAPTFPDQWTRPPGRPLPPPPPAAPSPLEWVDVPPTERARLEFISRKLVKLLRYQATSVVVVSVGGLMHFTQHYGFPVSLVAARAGTHYCSIIAA